MEVIAIIPAAGEGKRTKTSLRKQFLPINGKPVLAHTLEKFQKIQAVDGIIVLVPRGLVRYCKEYIVKKYSLDKVFKVMTGGKGRQDSVRNGLNVTPPECQLVLVHDGVRPLISKDHILACIKAAKRYGAAITAVRAIDTVKLSTDDAVILETMDRKNVWLAQTPQVFRYSILKQAYDLAYKDGFYGTDEASLVERLGKKVKLVEGSYRNIKITTREDIAIAELILRGE